MLLSVVIPTYNEAGNIGGVVARLEQALVGIDYEVLVVDDDSKDGTIQVAEAASSKVRGILRTEERGLATAVVRGIDEAKGKYFLVCDGDGQHPASAVRDMIDKAVGENADLVLGSRHIEGGDDGSFSIVRRAMSRGASLAATVALPVLRKHGITDPMTGLFLCETAKVETSKLNPQGFKILLEIMGTSDFKTVREVGYSFGTREHGESKLGGGVMVQYLVHLLGLATRSPENRRVVKFGLVGLSGVLVNFLVLAGLVELGGMHYVPAAVIAIEISILNNFFLNDRFTFADKREGRFTSRLLRFNAVSLAALVVNIGVLILGTEGLGMHYLVAEVFGVIAGFGANYIGNLHWTYGSLRFNDSTGKQAMRWLPFLLVLTASGALFFADLDHVSETYWDESYYVLAGQQIVGGQLTDPCWDENDEIYPRPINYEHPPLGKLLIGWSSYLFDDAAYAMDGCRNDENPAYNAWRDTMREDGNPVAWRLPTAALGFASVLGIGMAAHRLFGTPGAAAVAGALVAMDNLVLGQARIAILDMMAGGFVALSIWAATSPTKRGLWLSSLLLTLGFTVKYTAAFAGPGILLLHWFVLHRAGRLQRKRFDLTLLAYAILPLPVLLLTWGPWLVHWASDMGFIGALVHWFDVQKVAIGWGTVGEAFHPDASRPKEWLPMTTPVWYYTYHDVPGLPTWEWKIFAIGNPVLWWSAVFATAYLATEFIRSKATSMRVEFAASLVWLSTYAVFWMIPRPQFLFYMVVVVPAMALPITAVMRDLWRSDKLLPKIVVPVWLLAILAMFIVLLPVTLGIPQSPAMFDAIFDAWPFFDPKSGI